MSCQHLLFMKRCQNKDNNNPNTNKKTNNKNNKDNTACIIDTTCKCTSLPSLFIFAKSTRRVYDPYTFSNLYSMIINGNEGIDFIVNTTSLFLLCLSPSKDMHCIQDIHVWGLLRRDLFEKTKARNYCLKKLLLI